MEITSQEKLLLDVAKILNDLKINYFVTGGFAVSVWGRPRATFDIDIVIKLSEFQEAPLREALQKISEVGYIDKDAIREAVRNKGEFNFIDPDSGLKVDFWVANKEVLGPPEFKNKKLIKISGQKVYFVSPEDLILNKLQWHEQSQSERQLKDAESVLKISGKKLDMLYLKRWAKKLGILGILNKVIKI